MMAMIEEMRTERSFGVTAGLRPIQRRNLMALRQSEVWGDLLDVIEMVCIETETVLINTDPASETEVLANHKMAKAAWQMFAHLQEKIDSEVQTYLQSVAKQPPIPAQTIEEQRIENLLDPTKPLPEDEYEGAQR
jgi:hypothetical protein